MIKELKMPVLGLTMEAATVLEWVKGEGERVEQDETVLIVETDKAATDVPSPAAGILGRVVVAAGEEVPVGTVLAYLVDSQAEIASLPAPAATGPAVSDAATVVAAAGASAGFATAAPSVRLPRPNESAAGGGRTAVRGAGEGRVFASPRARAKAADLGVDLSAVVYAGERIIEQDVLEAAAAPAADEFRLTPLAARLAAELHLDLNDIEASPGLRIRAGDLLRAAAAAEAALGANGGRTASPTPAYAADLGYATGDIKKLNRVRRITAERMTIAAQTAPQVTYTTRVDMTKAIALRADLKEAAAARGVRLTYDSMFVRAAATALLEFPEANAQWAEGEGIRLSAEAHVGVAVDLAGEGLIVPVIRNAHARGLFDIAGEVDRLAGLAREGKLGPDDYKGGTFTVSNLGLFGIEAFTPILNLPEAAILGVGAIIPTPVYLGDELVKRQLCTLSLTADHRLVDGGPAARVLARIRELMETPLLLLERGL
jgi:pyruvate dehydrogenase E2 component (dihydrolipoamide acetyltransferase)